MTAGRLMEWITELLRKSWVGQVIIDFGPGFIKKISKKETVDLK